MNNIIQELSKAERILLAEALWDSVADEDDLFPLTEEQKNLLDVRLAKYKEDMAAGSTWAEVKHRITGE